MRTFQTFASTIIVSMLLVGPAHAAGSIALPDPSGGALFALGVAGLLIGRRIASKRKD